MNSQIPDLVAADGQPLCDHKLESAKFHVLLSANGSAHISKDQLLMSAGIKDVDHLNATHININSLKLEGGSTGSQIGVVLSTPNTPLSTAHRTTVIDSVRNTAHCVHAVATSTGLASPVKLVLGPEPHARNAEFQQDSIKKGLARLARWCDADPTQVGTHLDVETMTNPVPTAAGINEVKHLVNVTPGPNASLITTLFHRNQTKAFCGGAYAPGKRQLIGDDQFVVTDQHFTAAKQELTAHLTPTSMFKDGLTVSTVSLNDSPLATDATVAVEFDLCREPLCEKHMSAAIDNPMIDAAPLSLRAARHMAGDTASGGGAPVIGPDAKVAAVFAIP